MNQQVTIGHDAEGFLYGKGRIISSIGKIGGSKEEPLAVEGSKCGLKVQEDGVTIEFNQDPLVVDDTFEDRWYDSLNELSLQELRAYVAQKLGKEYGIAWSAAAEFSDEDLKHYKAREFGCDPDFLAHEYGLPRMAIKARQVQQEVGNFRFAGGHIHIGYDQEGTGIRDFAMVQLVEAYCYFPLCRQDFQYQRQGYYGLAGLYRPKPYGVEYRTPSNFWVADYQSLPINIGKFASCLCDDPDLARDLYSKTDFRQVREFIDNPGRNRMDNTYAKQLRGVANEIISAKFKKPEEDDE